MLKGLLKIHTRPVHYLYTLTLAALIFDGYYLVMTRLPSVGDVPACTIGGALTTENLLFSAFLSLITALMIAGMIRLYFLRKNIEKIGGGLASSSMAGLGFIVGFFTVFCALCTIPIISVFGLAIGLGFFTTYNLTFKIISLALMLFSLILLDRQLNRACDNCKVKC